MKNSRETLKSATKNTGGDFLQHNRFTVEIDGVTAGGIMRCDGLGHEHEMIVYQDSDDHFSRLRPGRQKVGTLTLDRLFANTEFFDWFKTVYEGDVQRKSISIVYLTDDGTESSRVNLHDCWPKKWKISGMNSRNSDQIMETLEIMYERVELA
ncbi:MAG TPA: phage tail protein [Myxococcales bacterium]|nr:phage tail protein [Myxococcales bacterium]